MAKEKKGQDAEGGMALNKFSVLVSLLLALVVVWQTLPNVFLPVP